MYMLSFLLLLAAPRALAIDADTFDSTGSTLDEQGGLQVISPTLGESNDAYGGLMLVYGHNPVVQVFGDDSREVIVGSQFAAHLMGGYTVGKWVRLDLDVPLYPYVGGPGQDFNGFGMGDIKVAGVVRLLDLNDNPVGFAVVPQLSMPTGSSERFTGAGSVSGGLTASVAVRPVEKLLLAANLGISGSKGADLGEFTFGSGLTGSLGANYQVVDAIGVGAELDGLIGIAGGVGPYNKNPIEGHVYGTYGTGSGLVGTLGLGTGLVAGVGAPDVRVILGVGYHAPGVAPIKDTDADGILDDVDECIDIAEDHDQFQDENGCPDRDNDADGIEDDKDACRNDAEDADSFEDSDGCPELDNDKDGVADTKDQCPLEPGDVATDGCPDRDHDTVVDVKDQCPDEAGPASSGGCPDRDSDLVPDNRDKCPDVPRDPREEPSRSDGCPKKVIVTAGKLEILDKVFFDTNKTTIKKQSFPLLDLVAKTLNDNLDLTRVEVAGHTDSDGADAANLKLSQGRAEAVVKYLVTVGKVAAGRLTAVGYGETVPIDTNATTEGKGNNRRVEFVIKEQADPSKPLPQQR
jgi:outer membrane protein OmpA-like peptidoglycan-associated protein